MSRKDYKAGAKALMQYKSIIILISLLFTIATAAVSAIGAALLLIPFIGIILFLAVLIVMFLASFQLQKAYMDVTNDQSIDLLDFRKMKKAVCVFGRIFLKELVPCLIYMLGALIMGFGIGYGEAIGVILIIVGIAIIVFGLVKLIQIAYGVMFSYFMLYDGAKYDMFSAKDIVEKSIEITNGHKMDLFVLELSFIGWFLLVGVIGMIPIIGWLVSFVGSAVISVYMVLTQIQMYKNLEENNTPIINLTK